MLREGDGLKYPTMARSNFGDVLEGFGPCGETLGDDRGSEGNSNSETDPPRERIRPKCYRIYQEGKMQPCIVVGRAPTARAAPHILYVVEKVEPRWLPLVTRQSPPGLQFADRGNFRMFAGHNFLHSRWNSDVLPVGARCRSFAPSSVNGCIYDASSRYLL